MHNINPIPIVAFFISIAIVFSSFVLQGNKGFNLWDEGFLWYGVQRVLQGEVPIRDYMAYDPGRYYWSAALLSIIGKDDIMSLRAVVAIFQALGLFAGLFLITPAEKQKSRFSTLFWILSALTLAVWMFPRHKLFDISVSIMLIGALTFLISNPTPRRYLIAGIAVGMIAVFGRNHGLYGTAGSLGIIAWLSIRKDGNPGLLKGTILWGAGVAIGFLPIILMTLFVPGFLSAFIDSIRLLFEQNSTNLPLPIPWPWTVELTKLPAEVSIRSILIGLYFVSTLAFGTISIAWVVYRRITRLPVPPAFAASAFLALPYAHFAFSRADIGHLAQGIYPTIIGLFVILAATRPLTKLAFSGLLFTTSFAVMLSVHPGWQYLVSKQFVDVNIAGHNLQVDPGTAKDIELLRKLSSEIPEGHSLVATPFWPGAYALLNRKSPTWEIYALFPKSPEFEYTEIDRIKASNPSKVILMDFALDGRDELRFKNTHPRTYQYIIENFDLAPTPSNPALTIYTARNPKNEANSTKN